MQHKINTDPTTVEQCAYHTTLYTLYSYYCTPMIGLYILIIAHNEYE